ncbi:MAG TPA: hypothetical protein VFT55_04970, partial [Planctomycetota bacterium]|nr:hypothetical protein [Planctomycetota bacterium]
NSLQHLPVWLTSPQAPSCPQGMHTVQYSLLEITLAHRTPGSGPLSLTFANNLPSPPPPPVFPAQAVTIPWTTGDWDGIAFAQPFAYNGVDDIVVEIRKVVVPTGQNVGTLRNLNSTRIDLPRQVQVGGLVGSGASSAATGTYGDPLGWRLRFDNDPAPTLEVRSPLGPTSLHYTHGTTIHFRVFAPTGDVFVLAASFGFFPVSVPIAPFGGQLWLMPPIGIITADIVAPAPGAAYHRIDFPLPPDPALAGMLIGAQVATLGIWTGLWELTNAVDFVIM